MNAGPAGTTSSRDAYHRIIENSLSWLKGSHSITIGGNYMNYQLWNKGQQIVPELRFDVVTGDPAEAMFNNAANFPGASATDITQARRLYAILTGRVSEVRGIARLNETTGEYEYLGQGIQRARQRQVGLWLADSWRMSSNFTLNYGARYDLTFPFVAENNSYSVGNWEDVFGASGVGNLFKPGTLTGKYPEFHQLEEGVRVYPMDWNNVAPSVGFAWQPGAGSGKLGWLSGQSGDLSVRGGYSRSFTRLGLADFTNETSANPGVALNVFRQQGLNNLGALPLLLRNRVAARPGQLPRYAGLPDAGRRHRGHQPLQSRLEGALCRHLAGGHHACARNQHVDRGALRRRAHARQLAHQQLQRDQHHREWLPRRVQAGDDEPAGQQRRRRHARRVVRVLRAGHGYGAAADLPRLLQRHQRRSRR